MSRRGKRRIDSSRLNKILLIRLRRMGDVLMTTPAVTALKDRLPQAKLTYVVEEPYRKLVEGSPYLDEVLVLPRRQAKRDFVQFVRQVRQEGFDALVDFHGGPRAFWLTLFSKAKVKIGYAVKYKSFVYDIKVPRRSEDGSIHSVENHVNLVRALGVRVDPIPPLSMPEAKEREKERIREFLTENKLGQSKIITLHIGAGNEFRDWGINNVARLIELLSGHSDLGIVLVGGEEDRGAAQEIMAKTSASILSLAGQLNLRELRELICRSFLFVGPDSGPMHVAATTSTPIVAYFGPTLPAHFAPWQARATILEKHFSCRPCEQKTCLFQDFRCLRTITPDDVFAACRNFL